MQKRHNFFIIRVDQEQDVKANYVNKKGQCTKRFMNSSQQKELILPSWWYQSNVRWKLQGLNMKKNVLEKMCLRDSFFMYISCSMHLEHVGIVSKRLNIIYISIVMISTLH